MTMNTDQKMSQIAYKSSVLRCHDPGDADCVTCRFLSGDESQKVLQGVILNLDSVLFEKESLVTTLLTSHGVKKREHPVVYGKVMLRHADSLCWWCPVCDAFHYGCLNDDDHSFPETVKCKVCAKQFETGASK